MLSHAESMMVVEKPPPTSNHGSTVANTSDIYEPSGLLSFDTDDTQTNQPSSDQSNTDTATTGNELSDLFLDLGVSSTEKTATPTTATATPTTAVDTSSVLPNPSSSNTASSFDDAFSSPPPSASGIDKSQELDSAFAFDSPTTTPAKTKDNSTDFDTSFFDSAPVTPEPAKKQSPAVKTPPPSATKKKASSGGKPSSITPPGAASSSAALAKRKKAQANAGALRPPALSPVKKPSLSLSPSTTVSSSSKTTPPRSTEAPTAQGGFNFDEAFSSPPPLPTPSPSTTVPIAEESCVVDVTLNSFEELLSVTKKGVLEKFEMAGTVKMNASCAAGVSGSSGQLGREEEVVVQLVVTDPQQHLGGVTAAPPTAECKVAVTGKHAATVKLSALPAVSSPLLAYRAAPSFRPELLRAKSVVTVSPDGKAISVSIQVMLNTKYPALLKGIHVLASLAPVVDATGGDIQEIKSRPASGVYNSARRVLSWECGDHLPAKMPMLKMEALLALPAALTSPTTMPSSVPIIVKALMDTPLLVDCKVEVSSVAISSAQQHAISTSSPGIHSYKSKCEYQFL